FLVELFPFYTIRKSHHGNKPFLDVRQHYRSYFFIVIYQISFGEFLFRKKHLVGIANAEFPVSILPFFSHFISLLLLLWLLYHPAIQGTRGALVCCLLSIQ